MCDTIQIFPDSLRTGVPITARVHAEHQATAPRAMNVEPKGQAGLEPFLVPLEIREGHLEGQFTVSVPGKFHLTLGNLQREIEVAPQRDLSFEAEFGIFSLVVAICVGGMIAWLRKQKNTAGSASPSGPS